MTGGIVLHKHIFMLRIFMLLVRFNSWMQERCPALQHPVSLNHAAKIKEMKLKLTDTALKSYLYF